MMGQLQEAQKQAEEIKERLGNTYIKHESNDISIVISGNRELKDIIISGNIDDTQELQDKLVLAMNQAIEKANKLNEEEMQKAAKGMLPGF